MIPHCIRQVHHDHPEHQQWLRKVYGWAKNQPELYLEGSGYMSDEEFAETPDGAIEYCVWIDGELSGLLSFFRQPGPLKFYRVGLITRPGVSVWKLVRVLRGFRFFISAFVQVLSVELPDSPAFEQTRRLARLFDFEQAGKTEFLLIL